jgi:hypothetical protein
VGAKLPEPLCDAFAKDGGITPEAAVADIVAVVPEVEEISLAYEIVTKKASLEERLVSAVLEMLLDGGGVMPDAPVEK